MGEREQSYVERVRQGLDALNRGDLDGVTDLFGDEIEVRTSTELPNSGHYRGREGFLEWATAWLEAWDTFRVEIRETTVVGEVLVASVRQFGSGRGSGLEVEMNIAYVVRFRDGKVVTLEVHPDAERALAEVRGEAGS